MNKKNQSGYIASILIILVSVILLASFIFIKNRSVSKSTQTVQNTQSEANTPKATAETTQPLNLANYTLVNDPKFTDTISRANPCEEARINSPNTQILVGNYTVTDKSITMCKYYYTETQTCFSTTDKETKNPLQCENTKDGPYNMLFAYKKISENKYTAVYIADKQDKNWAAWGIRTKKSIPNLLNRKDPSNTYYLFEPTDPCPIGEFCGDNKDSTRYYDLDDDYVLVMRYSPPAVLTGRGG